MSRKKIRGFTIVELLIVIVVIGILAAITIVAYNGIQNRAHDTAVQNDLSNISKKMELYKIDSPNGWYAFGNVALEDLDMVITKSAYNVDASITYNLLNCTSSSSAGSDYAMLAISKSGKRYYVSSSSGGVKEYTGAVVWGTLSMCGSVLANSVGNGAGYHVDGGWRTWTN